MLSNQVKVYNVITKFFKYYEKLIKTGSIVIKPHYVSNPHPLYELGISTTENNADIFKDCYGKGKYCITGFSITSEDFETKNGKNAYNLDQFNNPVTIIEENLIQKCIFNYSEKKNQPLIFYNYLINFYQKCIQENNFTKECGKAVILSIKELDIEKLNECVYNSFNFSGKLN
jgi:hypothetical protein